MKKKEILEYNSNCEFDDDRIVKLNTSQWTQPSIQYNNSGSSLLEDIYTKLLALTSSSSSITNIKGSLKAASD